MSEIAKFNMGDWVYKPRGDYRFEGDIRAVLRKRSGAVRYVVENSDGVLHIFSGEQLELDEAKQRASYGK